MKWDNKGHQFDSFAQQWNAEWEYYLWGAAYTGRTFYHKFKNILKIRGFIDGDPQKQGQLLDGLRIFAFEEVRVQKNFKIIITSALYHEIGHHLISLGYVEKVDFCDHRLFTSVYFMYHYDQLYLYRADVSITNRCTLRCRDCNMLMPHFKSPQNKSLQMIKEDVDAFFQWVDHLDLFHLLGGEPFLHPHLLEIIEYIGKTYKNNIHQIELSSNGMVMPSVEVLKLCNRYSVRIQLSDYSTIVGCKAKVEAFIAALEQQGIKYLRLNRDQWLDFGLLVPEKQFCDEAVMIRFCDHCAPPFRGLHDKKLYFCHLNTSAVQAGVFADSTNDYFDLRCYDKDKRKLLMEFDAGYSERGYVTFCRCCRGCPSVNDRYVEVARQVDQRDSV